MTTVQFTRSMATLLAGGITLVESFQIALVSVTNLELLRSTEPALQQIREGKPFTESLAAAGWVPELAIDMIASASVPARCVTCWTKSPASMTPRPKSSSAN